MPTPAHEASTIPAPTESPTPLVTVSPPAVTAGLTGYEFPGQIDANDKYLFYLHGKIIEDQGIPAVSSDYGEYEYFAILEELAGYGFIVVSEQRSKNTNAEEYARKIVEQINTLLDKGVSATNITIVGASKGGGIAIYVSHFLDNPDVNYVILAICNPDTVEGFTSNQIFLTGNVLSIYDFSDELAGSCQELFSFSQGKGLSSFDEIALDVGTGHGILYQPLDEWILPAVQWANGNFR